MTDDRPRIEYTGWVRQKAFVPVLRELLALQSDPPLTGADDSLQQAIRRERDNLQTFYAAGLDAYEGNRQAWSHHITEAIQADPDNPYYRWFTGGGR
ncbi:hypothetical protein D3C81_1996810 [compost metagenome]